MSAIIINNFRRLWAQKQLIYLLVIFTAIASVAAVFVSSRWEQRWDVALLSGRHAATTSDHIRLYELDTAPTLSALVSGRYDAVLTISEDGNYHLDTLKSESETLKIMQALEGNAVTETSFNNRGVGTNILGFLLTFLLLIGSMAMCMYANDKAQGQLTRIAASPVKIGAYLLSHCLFNFCYLYFPVMAILLAVCRFSGVNYGFSFYHLAGLIAVACAFSTAFSLLLYSLLSNKAESAKMAGNALIILTTFLAGGFYSFTGKNSVLDTLTAILPQKAFLTAADRVEQLLPAASYIPCLGYILLLTIIFIILSIVKTKSEYVNQH